MEIIAGVIHPTSFQKNSLLEAMSPWQSNTSTFFHRHKNIELAAWSANSFHDKKKGYNLLSIGRFNGMNKFQVLEGYEKDHEGFLKDLRGQFALALFDESTEQLFLFRDPIGTQVLYWYQHAGYFLFSNDLKTLLRSGIVAQTPAIDGLAAYFHFGYVPQDLTPIKGVFKLLPGHYLTANLKNQVHVHQYWSFSKFIRKKETKEPEEKIREINSILEKKIQNKEKNLFLTCDPGTLALSSYFADQIKPSYALAAIFEGSIPSEFKFCRQLSQYLGLHYKEKTIYLQESLNDLIEMIWHCGEPIALPSLLESWHMAKLAAQTKTSTNNYISSLGWEQMFLAKPSYQYFLNANNKKTKNFSGFLNHASIRKLFLPAMNFFYPELKFRMLRRASRNELIYNYLLKQAIFPPAIRSKASPFLFKYFEPDVFCQRFHKISLVKGKLDPLAYFDIKTFLPDYLLFAWQKSCSHFQLDIEFPFLEESIVESLAMASEQERLHKGQLGYLIQKLNEEKFEEKKHLCSSRHSLNFIDVWRKNPKCRSFFSHLKSGLLAEENLISSKWVKTELGYPYIVAPSFLQLWSVLTLEIWFRLFINAPVEKTPPKISLNEFLGR